MLKNLADNFLDLDQECREYFLKSDIDLTSIIMVAVVFTLPPLAYLDYSYYGFNSEFFLVVFLEGLFAAFSIFLLFYFRSKRQVKTYETLVFIWSLSLAIGTPFADFLQPNRIVENLLISELLIIALYMLIANRLLFRIIPIVLITVACIAALFVTKNDATSQEKYIFTTTLILLNAAGSVVYLRNNRYKNTEFESLHREKEARKQFEELAASDPLTGILNRRSFIEHTRTALHRFERYQNSFCLAIMDLDHLKQINDTYGHLSGDQAIKQFTALIESNKRLGDVFGRLGGDEFGFILPMCNQTDGQKIISRLQNTLRTLVIKSPIGDFHISFSAGVTGAVQEDRSPDDLMHRADLALYESKNKKHDQTL